MEASAEEVHLWAIDLAVPETERNALTALLSSDELLRAANMRVEAARRRFLVARGALRVLLARYLGAEPDELIFETGERGKPSLTGSPLCFSVTHSGELCLIAVTGEHAVGVDVELLKPRRDPLRVAQRYFTPGECEAIEEAPDPAASFYLYWVAKEAFLKATGLGITGALASFEVDLRDAPRIAHVGGDEEQAKRWSLELLDVPPAYAGALVTERGCRAAVLRTFNPLAESSV